MKIKTLISTCAILFYVIQVSWSQDPLVYDLSYEINKAYPSLSVKSDQLASAKTIADLNSHYKPDWIKEFKSVEISTSNEGQIRKASSLNDILTIEQKENIQQADHGSAISVDIRYIPNNTLSSNDIKEIKFSFTIEPTVQAQYKGGNKKLMQYLKSTGIDQITHTQIERYNLAAVTFTIDEDGKITDAQLYKTTDDPALDDLLLQTVCNMPSWHPAQYADGTRVKQEFVFTVGDMTSCVKNLLHIRQL